MKKQLGTVLIITTLLLGACGQNSAKTTNQQTTEQTTEQTAGQATNASNAVDKRLKEPTKDTVCEFCNMKVFDAKQELGAFTAQAIKKDGSTIFFDDIGCMLNQERKDKVTYEKFVRDYNSKDWFKLDDAIIVKADIKTPMNYGYAFFKDQKSADAFMKEHKDAQVVQVSDIDEVAHKRYEMKMKKMQDMKNNDSNKKMDMHSDDSNSDSQK
ncbi:nitrous oxide reductase accessory protein NosL [Rummeliibacillus pycnus]|uniref:nitrous oxide reductase accessory protein NosL n=1 Tax=Rummeliibacillus pycnus TaxID=101070 RepID=UPI000C9B4982|nr:nitrous oxide reductase accessory protein NosL [Rummeliibacillus pycnus]